MAKKLTKNQIEFKKQVARIKRGIRTYEKRGIHFNNVPDLDMPKRVTKKKLQELKSLKPKKVAEKYGVSLDFETGEFISAKEFFKIEKEQRKRAKQLSKQDLINQYTNLDDYQDFDVSDYPDFSDIILSNFRAELQNFPEGVKNIFYTWLDEVLKTHRPQTIAELIEDAKQRGLINYSFFGSDEEMARYTVTELTYDLPHFSNEKRQELFKELENLEDWTE